MASTSTPEGDPESLSVRTFVAARVAEIASLTNQIGKSGATNQGRVRGFSFQHVSKHMRRRAVSHNPKRLPTRLRFSHLAQLSKSSAGIIKKPKKPRRLHRNRSDGDILEYNRRQLANPAWLESHIWHAKRFHMKPMWGKRLADAPTAKCFRSLFHAAKNRAIMQDISYLSCFQLTGPKPFLLQGLKALTLQDQVPSQGNQEFLAHLYSKDSSYVGAINYYWASHSDNIESDLILWLHPASRDIIVHQLESVFELKIDAPSSINTSFPETPNKDEQKYFWKSLRNPVWSSSFNNVRMSELSGCLNRIRMTGTKTLPVLQEICKIGCFNEVGGDGDMAEARKDEVQKLWQGLKRIVDVPSDTVISINVVDPRIELPKKRERVQVRGPEEKDIPSHMVLKVIKESSLGKPSPIWDKEVRESVIRSKLSEKELAQIRSRNLIPGTSIDNQELANVVPVVLVLRAGRSTKCEGSFVGADLIVPMGWMMPFWIALSYRCVRAYGLEFSDYLTFESDPFQQSLPIARLFPPDSPMFPSQSSRDEPKLRSTFFSRPPAKRQNLMKLGCAMPFSQDFPKLLKHISPDFELVNVIRRTAELNAIYQLLKSGPTSSPGLTLGESDSALLPVYVELLSGAIEERACLFLPTSADLNLFYSNSKLPIAQSQLTDSNEKEREELTRRHHKRMSNLRKKRKATRRAAAAKGLDLNSRLEALDSREESEQFNSKLNSLWLFGDGEDVLGMQDREVVGLTTYGHYSFLKGRSGAVGYANLGQLKKLAQVNHGSQGGARKKKENELLVLVRNWTTSLTYHWGVLKFPES